MDFARNVGKAFSPLDEELELLPVGLTPHGHECLVRLSSWMPFEKAVELLGEMMGIWVSKSQARRYTERAGQVYVEIQAEEVERIEKERPVSPMGGEKMQVSADGAMVPLLHGEWGEVKTLVIGEIQPARQEKGEWVVHTRNLSYFSRRANAQEFGRQTLVEMHRRGVEKARQVVAVMDGAEWEQGFIDYHCPEAVRVLDFPHAGERMAPVGDYLYGEKSSASQAWVSEKLHQLKHEGPAGVLNELRTAKEQHPEVTVIAENLAYLEKREKQMQYPEYQRLGYPIGSGIVESGNKLVVEARLKGSGMHWANQNVNSMLALRNILCSDRWKEEWEMIERRIRLDTKHQRQTLHQSREAKKEPAQLPVTCAIVAIAKDSPGVATDSEKILPSSPKKNRWKDFKYGATLYRRSASPKK